MATVPNIPGDYGRGFIDQFFSLSMFGSFLDLVDNHPQLTELAGVLNKYCPISRNTISALPTTPGGNSLSALLRPRFFNDAKRFECIIETKRVRMNWYEIPRSDNLPPIMPLSDHLANWQQRAEIAAKTFNLFATRFGRAGFRLALNLNLYFPVVLTNNVENELKGFAFPYITYPKATVEDWQLRLHRSERIELGQQEVRLNVITVTNKLPRNEKMPGGYVLDLDLNTDEDNVAEYYDGATTKEFARQTCEMCKTIIADFARAGGYDE